MATIPLVFRLSVLVFFVLCLSQSVSSYESLSEFHIPFVYAVDARQLPFLVAPEELESPLVKGLGVIHTAASLAVEMLNNRTCDFPEMLPNTKLVLDTYSTFLLNAILIPQMMALGEQNVTFTTGFVDSQEAIAGSVVGSVFDIATLSFFAPDGHLSDERTYPYFSRTAINNQDQIQALHEALTHYNNLNGGRGWNEVAIFSEASPFTAEYATNFIETGLNYDINVVEYQTAVSLVNVTPDYTVELTEIKNSGARVILCLFILNYEEALNQANDFGLIGDDYVWIISQATTEFTFSEALPLARGTMVSGPFVPDESPYRTCFEQAWLGADPILYPYAGRGELPSVTTFDVFDMIIASALAIDSLDREEMLDGRYIHPSVWSEAIRSVTLDGLEGFLSFRENGDRVGTVSISYYDPDANTYVPSGIFDEETGYTVINDFVWFSNTTEVPDLDIREPFDYWSCHDKEKKHDPTGKKVEIHTPDGSDVDEISSHYHCDAFIDCENLSDESVDCNTNYLILFIVFGIVIGLLILLAVVLIAFVTVFGLILKYRRLKAVSPLFLILLLASVVIGFASLYAFFGKAHPVACAFQPWLLGLPSISMIAVLTVKNYRIWRIFRYPLKRTQITDLHLFVLWVSLMIPAIFIVVLWTIISTPTAAMKERQDGDHYICTTGGFTGEPGGIIFFSIFVVYGAIVLIIGAVISFLSRNVPSGYNESKLLTISIYNLGFLAVVIIPVFLVVNPFNPFLAWILRTLAIMYAFGATMLLQFVPVTFNIIIVDKGKNISKGMITTGSGSSNSRSLSLSELNLNTN